MDSDVVPLFNSNVYRLASVQFRIQWERIAQSPIHIYLEFLSNFTRASTAFARPLLAAVATLRLRRWRSPHRQNVGLGEEVYERRAAQARR